MKIGLHANQLCLRGTSVALYDYAWYLREFGYDPIILYNFNSPWNIPEAKDKFSTFRVIGYSDFSIADDILKTDKVEHLYFIKGGNNDGLLSKSCKNLIHAVFPYPSDQAHGDVYAFVSKWLSEHCSKGEIPYVPHMINLPNEEDDLRAELNIPKNATVFGRYGGLETFDITFVHDAIREVLSTRKDVYFIFMNTYRFFYHPNIIYLNGSSDLNYKVKFINTCDAMIHARHQGESFGISVGEFSTRNKRVITYLESPERSHIEILGDKGLYYSSKEEIMSIINTFNRSESGDFNCYKDFTPEKVIKIFKEVFHV